MDILYCLDCPYIMVIFAYIILPRSLIVCDAYYDIGLKAAHCLWKGLVEYQLFTDEKLTCIDEHCCLLGILQSDFIQSELKPKNVIFNR